MSEPPIKPSSAVQKADDLSAKSALSASNMLAIATVCSIVVGFCIGVWQLSPKPSPTGRPIGTAGKVQVYSAPATPAGEGFTIWRDGRQVGGISNAVASTYQRIELSSNDIDIAGNSDPDIMLYAWTGGAHCCFTQILVDGRTGKLLGQFELGNGDPMPFLAAPAAGLPRAVAVNFDDVTAYKFGSFVDSQMARIIVAWDGKRFGLDLKRMKATSPNNPPSYFIAEPDLGDAIALGVQDFGESEEVPAATPKLNIDTPSRGDRAKTYETWLTGEEARMRATALNIQDKSSFGPMAAFLNEQIYKGQATAGVATVLAAYETTPQDRDAALSYYFNVLRESRWINDLNALNDGQLTAIITKQTNPLPTPAASP